MRLRNMSRRRSRCTNGGRETKMEQLPDILAPPCEAAGAESVTLHIPVGEIILTGDLEIPENARGLVLFAHGSGSSRRSPRNQAVAAILRQAGLGTLLFDLLTPYE